MKISNGQKKRAKKRIHLYQNAGKTFMEFLAEYDGLIPDNRLQAMWYASENTKTLDSERDLEDIALLLKGFAEQMRRQKEQGVEDWALASFCDMSEKDFSQLMALLGV